MTRDIRTGDQQPAVHWEENVGRDVVRVLMEQYSSVAQALSELVDNPIDQRRGRRLTISLEIDKAKDIIVVEDHGGGGMDAADIAEWLNWGSGRERKATDISRWRIGGKAACGYLGNDLVLYAKAAGSSDVWFFEDHDWATRSEAADWGEPQPLPSSVPLPSTLADAGREDGFVRIEISKLRQRVYNIDDLRWELSNTYRALLERGDIVIEINGQPVLSIELPRNSKRKDTPIDLKTSLGHRVRGWVGRLDRDRVTGASARRRIRGGLRCTYQGRLVCPGEYFGHSGDTKGSLASLIGEVELGFVPPNLTKTDFDRGSPEWAALEEVMTPFMAPIVKEFREAGETRKASRRERKSLSTVCEELAEAFRRSQQPETWPGHAEPPSGLAERGEVPIDPPVPGIGGKRRRKGKSKRNTEASVETSDVPQDKPRKRGPNGTLTVGPDIDEAVGRMVRLLEKITGGSLTPPARLEGFDPAFRSRWEADGKKMGVVINTSFPLYAEFKGNPPYLAETIIMKLAEPVEGESRTVADYVAEVTNMTSVWARVHQGADG